MRQGLERWMDWQKVSCLDEVRGRVSLERLADPAAFERAGDIRTLQSWGIRQAIVLAAVHPAAATR